MALVSRMVSDVTGKEAPEEEFVQLVVRRHPGIDSPVALDVLPDEVANLKMTGEVVILELKTGTETKNIVVNVTEFRKVVPDKIVKSGRKVRGRRPGTTVSRDNGSSAG